MRMHICRIPALMALLTFLALACGLSARPAAAVPQTAPTAALSTTYSTKKREFRVGILLLDSTINDQNNPNSIEFQKGPENPDPYIFYIADAITELKPQGWEFVNPIAPATVTNNIKVRWDARSGGESGYTVGQKVTKDMACYWEVSLTDTTLNNLLQFDLLFITNHRTTAFTPADREKMRKLVDAGGIVWIEDCGNMRIGTDVGGVYHNDRFFLDQLQFTGGTGGNPFPTSAAETGPIIYQPNHPILNTPYQLTFDDVANLGDKNYADYAMVKIDPLTNKRSTTPSAPNPETLVNIVGNRSVGTSGGPYQPYIAAGYYGSGAVIVTSGDSGCDINDYAGGTNTGSGGNSGAFCGPNIRTAHPMDLKFLYNCVAWGGSNSSFRRNNRRAASTFEGVGAPLLEQFDITGNVLLSPDDLMSSQSAPLFINGMMFVTGVANGRMVLRAIDPKPQHDYDGDGNTDDGRPDLSLGYGYDQVWSVDLGPEVAGEMPSAPVYGEVDLGNTAAQKQQGELFVTLPDGTVRGFLAFPVNTYGQVLPTGSQIFSLGPTGSGGSASASGTYDPIATHAVSPSPVFSENKIFEVQPSGMIRCLSAVDGSLQWWSFDATTPPNGSTIVASGTPTLGLSRLAADITTSRNPNSATPSASTALANNSLGATSDLMLYIPATVTPSGATAPTGSVLAYWLGARNEVQVGFTNDQYGRYGTFGEYALMNTRISGGTGTPGAFVYGMAPGPTAAGAPFTFQAPRIRVYSAERYPAGDPNGNPEGAIQYSAAERYAAGIESTAYAGSVDVDTATGLPTGRIRITRIDGSKRKPGPMPWTNNDATGNEPDILISVDYDVTYITPSGAPKNYTQNNTQIGARFNTNLAIPNYDAGLNAETFGEFPIPAARPSLDTTSFSPLDTLIYGALQNQSSGTTDTREPMLSLFGLHEEEGNTILKWRFTLPHALAATGLSQATGQVNDVVVNDDYPIQNGINFDRNWPLVDVADKPNSVVLATSGGTPLTKVPITLYRTVGSPIVTGDGTTLVLAEGAGRQSVNGVVGPAYFSVLMALKSEPGVTLTLPRPFDATQGVTVSQLDALSNNGTTNPRVITTSANNSGNSVLLLDGQRGKIQIRNFNNVNAGAGQFSASQSFVVSCTPVGEAAPRTFIVLPKPEDVVDSTATSTTGGTNTTRPVVIGGGFTPILWYYVLLGKPQSAPTLIGDYVFFTLKNMGGTPAGSATPGAQYKNFLMAVDADPASNDGNVHVGFSEQVINVFAKQSGVPTIDQKIDHTRMAQLVGDLQRNAASEGAELYTSPPVAAGGVLALNGNMGTFGYTDQTTLIADAHRIIEVGADGGAQWALDGTQQRSVIGGPLPVYDRNGALLNPGPPTPNGRYSLDSRTIAHPSTARRIGNGDYLIADTGNNRVLRVDRAGVTTWSVETLSDPFQILGGGEPTGLNGPTDVQYYLTPTFDNPSAPTKQVGYEVHYLIADSGNNRVVEVADYYDANGQLADAPGTGTASSFGSTKGQHVVVWATRTGSQQGRKYRFESVSRYLGVKTDPATGTVYYGYPYVIATVSNTRVAGGNSSASNDFSGGSLVSLNYAPYQTSIQVQKAGTGGALTSTYIMPWQPPATPTPVAIANTEPPANGTVLAAANDLQIRDTAGNLVVRRLAHPTYFQQLVLPSATAGALPRTVYLICDSDGVYAVYATTDTAGNPIRQVVWMFRQQEYDAINGYDDVNNVVLDGRVAQPAGGDPKELPRFLPSSVRMLPNGHFLISNSWTGKTALFQNGKFVGEVFEVDPSMNLIQQLNAIDATPATPTLFYSGGTTGYMNKFSGLFAAPRLFKGTIPASPGIPTLNDQIMGTPGNTNLLEQPLFGDRQ